MIGRLWLASRFYFLLTRSLRNRPISACRGTSTGADEENYVPPACAKRLSQVFVKIRQRQIYISSCGKCRSCFPSKHIGRLLSTYHALTVKKYPRVRQWAYFGPPSHQAAGDPIPHRARAPPVSVVLSNRSVVASDLSTMASNKRKIQILKNRVIRPAVIDSDSDSSEEIFSTKKNKKNLETFSYFDLCSLGKVVQFREFCGKTQCLINNTELSKKKFRKSSKT